MFKIERKIFKNSDYDHCSWCFYCIATIVEAVIGESDVTILITRFLSSFGRLNCGINWIIFGVNNSTYRNAFIYIY